VLVAVIRVPFCFLYIYTHMAKDVEFSVIYAVWNAVHQRYSNVPSVVCLREIEFSTHMAGRQEGKFSAEELIEFCYRQGPNG
jgi:hypothetical protein